jgi:xylulokinase
MEEMTMDVYLGFDVGTTSIKAIAMERSGVILSSAKVPCTMESPKPGYFEIDAISQWKGGFLRALDLLGRDLVSQARAMCVSSVCASFVPVDTRGEPLRKAIMYGIDTRATSQFEHLNASMPAEKLAAITGSGFTSHSVLPKLLWLKENELDIYRDAAFFVESSNFITSFLTGNYAWDRPTAAGGHMIDVKHGEYPIEFLHEIGIDPEKLPQLRYPLEVLGKITHEASKITGIPEDSTVLVGACDVNAEAFACGAFDPGSLLVVFGSTISTLYTIGKFKTLPGFLIGPSVLEGTYRLGGATSSGGRYLDWLNTILGKDFGTDDQDIVDDSVPGDILMVPFLDGARIPYQNAGYRVLWYGMKSGTTRSELRKAAFESMGCELHELIRRFSQVGGMPSFAYVSGGLASNSRFIQIVANIAGMTLRTFTNVNAAYGDALMALSSIEGLEKTREILLKRNSNLSEVKNVEPDLLVFEAYEAKRDLYRSAIDWIGTSTAKV